MNRDNYAGKKNSVAKLVALSLAVAVPLSMFRSQPVEAGEFETAAAILLGTAIVVAAQDNHREHQARHIHHNEYKHYGSRQDGHWYCDTHHAYHGKKHRASSSKITVNNSYYYYSDRHRHQSRYSYNKGVHHNHSTHHSSQHKGGHHHVEAHWNTRVKAY